jgi:ATP-dependent exoDNAse (exonuclease V) alpha subunit
LSVDQNAAIRAILQSPDRIAGIRGLAGTGKTTALKELATACQDSGYSVRFCAPTSAATDILRNENLNAVTLAALLQGKQPEFSSKSVIILDEASAVGIDDMRRLFEVASVGRIILSGDTGQHSSVARGDALRLLERHSPFAFGQLTQIRRQRHADYRAAVELAAQGDSGAAFRRLSADGNVFELGIDKAHEAAATT